MQLQTFTAADGARLAWREHGRGPVMIALAGLTRNSHDFDYLMHHLPETLRVIRPDYRGRGESDWTGAASYTVVQEAADVVALMDPLCPARISHVIIPAHGIGLLSGRRSPADQGEWLDTERLFQMQEEAEKEQSFDRNAYELLIQRAIEQLSAAKKLHDELESHYVGHMDFLKWQAVLERILKELELA